MLTFNWKGLNNTWLPCKKIQGSFVQDFEFGEDCNSEDYLQWGELKLKVAFQLGSMGANNLPIEGQLLSQNSFVAQEGEMVDDWLNFFVKSKIKVPSWWRRDRRIRGHLGATTSQTCKLFEWSKLAK